MQALPQHLIDQYAARLRDTGADPALMKRLMDLVGDAFDASAEGADVAADAFPDVRLSLREVAELLTATGAAYRALGEQLPTDGGQ